MLTVCLVLFYCLLAFALLVVAGLIVGAQEPASEVVVLNFLFVK